mgnify:CR=1 FL=1
MNNEDILDKQIENYIHNRMTTEERIAFEESLNSNAGLRKNVNELVTLKLLYNKELFELKRKLDSVETQLNQENFFNDNKEP